MRKHKKNRRRRRKLTPLGDKKTYKSDNNKSVWGKKTIAVTTSDGKKRVMRVRKTLPKKTSVVRRICIKCQTSWIRKNDMYYETRICRDCQS